MTGNITRSQDKQRLRIPKTRHAIEDYSVFTKTCYKMMAVVSVSLGVWLLVAHVIARFRSCGNPGYVTTVVFMFPHHELYDSLYPSVKRVHSDSI